MATPSADAEAAIIAPSSRITRRVDIYEEDGTTPFLLNVGVLDGSIAVDASRSERRTMDLTLDNTDGSLDNYPENFWYDKIIKPYRGVQWNDSEDTYLDLDGTSTGRAYTDDASVFTINENELQVSVFFNLSSWSTGTRFLCGQWDGSSQNSWRFQINSSNYLEFEVSTTGSNNLVFTSPSAISIGTQYVRAVLYINNGFGGKSVNFFASTEGLSWLYIGTDTDTGLGTTALHDSTADFTVGGSAGSANPFIGEFYWAEVYDGIRLITRPDFRNGEGGAVSLVDEDTGIAYVLNGTAVLGGGAATEYSWETQLGEFMIDNIQTSNFPHTAHVTGRDYTKKLLDDQFQYATTFAEGEPVGTVIKAIALNGGIDKTLIPLVGETLGRDFTFEAQMDRWSAMTSIAQAYNYELYFDLEGYLVMKKYADPVFSPVKFTFETGEFGNLVSYEKSTSDSRMYNVVVVRSESSDTIPFTGVAENHEPSSPTSIENLNRRKIYNYTSAFIVDLENAEEVAMSILKRRALESFEISLTSITIPWLDVNDIVEFIDPDPNPGDPTKFLLVNFTIPMKLGGMTAQANRVTVVG